MARHGSFSAAAAALGITQPAVSQHVALLERRYGVRLLVRQPLALTPSGRLLRDHYRRLSRLEAELEGELARLTGAGTALRVGSVASIASLLAAEALVATVGSRPGVQVELAQEEPADSLGRLREGSLDVALVVEYRGLVLPRQGLRTRSLGAEPVDVALPPGHPLAGSRPVELAALSSDPWIWAPAAGVPLEVLRAAGSGSGFRPRVAFQGDDFRTVFALVRAGLGVALAPRYTVGRLGPGLGTVPLQRAPLDRSILVVTPAGHETSGLVSEFTRQLRLALARLAEDWSPPAPGGEVRDAGERGGHRGDHPSAS